MEKIQRGKDLSEALLQNQRAQKKYVTLTPYLQRGGKNIRVNVLGTISHTPESIANAVDTEGAIIYTEKLLKKMSISGNTLLQCELMHFVDANKDSGKLAVLPYLCGVCLSMSDKEHSEQKVFIVNFDEYFGTLKERFNVIMHNPNGVYEMTHRELIGQISKKGLDYSPCITIFRRSIKSSLSEPENYKKY